LKGLIKTLITLRLVKKAYLDTIEQVPKACPRKFVGYNSAVYNQQTLADKAEKNLPSKYKKRTNVDQSLGTAPIVKQQRPRAVRAKHKVARRPAQYNEIT